MQYLLDTHAFLWWMAGDTKLSKNARNAISSVYNEIFVSAASAWEIALKFQLGKLSGANEVAENISRCIFLHGFKELPMTVDDAQRAGQLLGAHRDPFDRMLIAQSQSRNLSLITKDRVFSQYRINILW